MLLYDYRDEVKADSTAGSTTTASFLQALTHKQPFTLPHFYTTPPNMFSANGKRAKSGAPLLSGVASFLRSASLRKQKQVKEENHGPAAEEAIDGIKAHE